MLFVRHSTRDKFPKGMPKDEENAQLLNAAGVELAHKCGEQLRDVGVAVKKVFSSPVQRCVQTAEMFGLDKTVETSMLLCASPFLDGHGSPEAFLWREYKKKCGWSDTVATWLNGTIPGIPDAKGRGVAAHDFLMKYIENGGLIVVVAHDLSVLCLAEALGCRNGTLDVPFCGGVLSLSPGSKEGAGVLLAGVWQQRLCQPCVRSSLDNFHFHQRELVGITGVCLHA